MTEPIEQRHQIEEEFHDAWAKALNPNEISVREAFEAITAVENRYVLDQMGSVKGKRILDLGCGMGDAATYFATLGAEVDAVDISSEMVKVTGQLARRFGVGDRVHPKKMLAEHLEFPNETFDFAYGNGVLHHVELEPSVREVLRVLKPNGRAFFIEPLSYNPLINIYRRLAAGVRTETEKPLTYRDIAKLRTLVSELKHSEFHLCTLFVFVWFYVVERADPSQTRYWKKILIDAPKYARMFGFLHGCDRVLLKLLPPLRPLCWNTVVSLKK